jgi:hypothetical protein
MIPPRRARGDFPLSRDRSPVMCTAAPRALAARIDARDSTHSTGHPRRPLRPSPASMSPSWRRARSRVGRGPPSGGCHLRVASSDDSDGHLDEYQVNSKSSEVRRVTFHMTFMRVNAHVHSGVRRSERISIWSERKTAARRQHARAAAARYGRIDDPSHQYSEPTTSRVFSVPPAPNAFGAAAQTRAYRPPTLVSPESLRFGMEVYDCDGVRVGCVKDVLDNRPWRCLTNASY